jgi:hypothetical protein
MTNDDYAKELDTETVARARAKHRWPDPAKVRRVRVDGLHTQMAVAANADREREGADDGRD